MNVLDGLLDRRKRFEMNQMTAQPQAQERTQLRPLHIGPAVLHFLLPGLLFRLSIYPGQKTLLDQGVDPIYAFLLSFGLPFVALVAWALFLLKREGVPFQRSTLSDRLQLRRFGWSSIGWLVLMFTASVVLVVVLAPIVPWMLTTFPAIATPSWFPDILNPAIPQTERGPAALDWMGDIQGRYDIALAAAVVFFFNIVGEEILWRGVVWPRQRLVHGQWTWLVHGLLWNLFHLPFYPWYLLFGLAATLPLSYLMQRTENTWLPMLMHALANVGTMGLFFAAVFS